MVFTRVTPVAVETACIVQSYKYTTTGMSERTGSRQSGNISTPFLLCPRFFFRLEFAEPDPSLLPPPPPPVKQPKCTML